MAEVTGTIGNEPVELNNAATEATLKKLLASMNTLNQSILKMPNAGGGGSASPINQITAAAGPAGKALGMLSNAFSLAGGIFGTLLTGAGVVAGAFVNLAEVAITGNAKMSDFYKAITPLASSIPIFGGLLGTLVGLFEKVALFQEKSLEQYQQLTNAGINFGGSLTDLRKAAINSYMSLEDFTGFMVKNSDVFAKLGGNVNTGAETFARLSNTLIKGGLGDRLLGLGYTTEQVNQGLADYIAITGGRNAKELKNTDAIVASSAQYMEQLDGLSRLTGQSREQMAEDIKKKSQNAAWEAKLQGMTEEQRLKAEAGLANALAVGGEGAADAFQAQIMGLAGPVTKAGQMYTGMYSQTAEQIRRSADMVTDGNSEVADMNKVMLDSMDTQVREGKKYTSQQLFAMGALGTEAGKTGLAVQGLNNRFAQSTREEKEAAMARKNLDDQQAKDAALANKSMQELGQNIMSGLLPIIQSLAPVVTGFVQGFADWFNKNVKMEEIGDAVKGFIDQAIDAGKKLAAWLSNFTNKAGQDKMINDIKYMFQMLLIELKHAIMPFFYDEEDMAEDKAKLDQQKKAADLRAGAAKELEGYNNLADGAAKEAALKKIKANIAEAERIEQIQKLQDDPMKNFGAAYARDASGKNAFERNRKEAAKTAAPISRANGSLGATGKLFEDFGAGTKAILHGKEAVVTPDQMNQMVSNSAASLFSATANIPNTQNTGVENNLADHLQRLNTLTSEMLKVMKETSDNIKKNVDATKALSNNVWA